MKAPAAAQPTSSAMRGSALPAVATPRAMIARLARQHGEDRVERRDDEGDQVREHRVDLEAVERAHRRPAPVPTVSAPVAPVPR